MQICEGEINCDEFNSTDSVKDYLIIVIMNDDISKTSYLNFTINFYEFRIA